MTNTLQETTRRQEAKVVNLFDEQAAPRQGATLRVHEQKEKLAKRAQEVAEMLDTLDVALKVDREGAVAMLAEYSGLLEVAVQEIACIREIDERFGGSARRMPRVAGLAGRFEKGLSYLVGMFSAVGTGENLSPFNWKLIERDVQMVLGMSRAICDEVGPRTVNEAA